MNHYGGQKYYLLQTTVGKSGWINLGEDAAELIECDTGEKLLENWKLFRYCNDPFMIQCLETACAQGQAILISLSLSELCDCNSNITLMLPSRFHVPCLLVVFSNSSASRRPILVWSLGISCCRGPAMLPIYILAILGYPWLGYVFGYR